MTLFWIIPGILLPTMSGWLLARLLEGRTPVLFRIERWVLGFALGLTITMFVTFLVHVTTGLPLSRIGHLVIQLVLVTPLGILFGTRKTEYGIRVTPQKSDSNRIPNSAFRIPTWLRLTIIILIVWTIIKILSTGFTFLLFTPPYLDDTVDNWNFRGKVFFTEQAIMLELPDERGEFVPSGLSSYPPTVPMVKSWLATLAGRWDEGLVNSVHFLWFLAVLALLYFALLRKMSFLWSLLGVYILTSLPLYLMHGSNPYADVFLSMHVFAAVILLYNAFAATEPNERMSFLRLGALATALLPFTKNEALLLYLPPILLILLIALWWKKKHGEMSLRETIHAILWYAIPLAAVLVPWIFFKRINGLTFGNAQAISNLEISWQPGVLRSIAINTFLEGNWLLLFPLFIFLLIVKRKVAFKTPLIILSAFFLIIYFGQIILYQFTYLSVEALYQTGYARGIIQLAPVLVMVVTVLLASCFMQHNEN